MGAILSLSHFSSYQFFNLFPFSVLQSNMFNVGRKLTRGIVVANLPPSTLQNNTFIVCGKLPRGVILKIYPPLEPSKPYGWFNIWRKVTCWVIAIDLPSGPLQTPCSTYEPTWHPESCLKCLYLPLQQSKTLNEQNWNFESCLESTPTGPYTAIHSTYGSSWHVDSFFWIYLPCPLRNAMFSVWTSMASLLMSKCSLPSPATRQYVEHMERKASWVIFEIYSPSTLQSNTLKETVKVDTSSFFTVKVDTSSYS